MHIWIYPCTYIYIYSCHPTIKFMAEYSLDKVNVICYGNKLRTDFIYQAYRYSQYLEFLSCHVYHSKKFIPCSQALYLIGFIQ